MQADKGSAGGGTPAGDGEGGAGDDGTGGGTPERNWLPKDLRGNEALQDVKVPGELANKYLQLRSEYDTLAEGTVSIPGKEATDEEVATFYGKLGRPETADGYEFDPPPEGVPKDEAFEPWLRERAHQRGLTKEQAKGIYADYYELVGKQAQQAQQKREEVEAKLHKDWGEKYDERVKMTQRAVVKLGGEEAKQLLETAVLADGTRLGDDPRMVAIWDKVAQQIGDDALVLGDQSAGSSAEEWYKGQYPSMKGM